MVVKTPISKLKLNKQGEKADYYNKSSDPLLYNALLLALKANGGDGAKAFANGFFKPKSDGTQGNIVRSVKTVAKASIGMQLSKTNAYADNGGMVRVDIFSKDGKYYVVPVYIKDVYAGVLPNKAIAQGKSYDQWPEMTEQYQFLFTLYPNDLVHVQHKRGFELTKTDDSGHNIVIENGYMYYRGINISTGGVSMINHDNSYQIGGLGFKTLQHVTKCSVDVLGNVSHVGHEDRQPLVGIKN